MKTIIAGSRSLENFFQFCKILKEITFNISLVISGGAKGIDSMAITWARMKNYRCLIVPAQWNKYGKSAGYRRNLEMAEEADALIAIWDGESKGTKHMIDIMESQNKLVKVVIVKNV